MTSSARVTVTYRRKYGTCRNRTRHNRWTICPNILRSLLKLTPGTLALRNQVGHVIFWFCNLTVTVTTPTSRVDSMTQRSTFNDYDLDYYQQQL